MPQIEKKASKELNILYQSDDNTQIGLGVSIASLLINNQSFDKITIYLINDGIEVSFLNQLKQYIDKFQRKLIVISSQVLLENNLVKQYPSYTGKRKNKHSYLKLFWQLGITNNIDKLLYLDCDTIINNDLSPLLALDMGNNLMGMAYDALITDEITHIGLNKDDPYYNSGVILFNAPKWLKEQCIQRIVRHLAENGNYGTVDQDVLNLVFRDQIYTLPIIYNLQAIHVLTTATQYCNEFRRSNYYEMKDLNIDENEIRIIHFLKFIGQNAWDKNSLHPCKDYFIKYLALTPWKQNETKETHSKPIFLVEKLLYQILPKQYFIKIFHIAHKMMINKSNFCRTSRNEKKHFSNCV